MVITKASDVRVMYKGLTVDDRTKKYVLKRLAQLDKILDKVLRVEIEIDLDKKKNKFRVEIMIKTPYELYRAENITESIEGSIDLIIDELKTQITRNKEKRKDLMKRGARSIKKKVVVDKLARF